MEEITSSLGKSTLKKSTNVFKGCSISTYENRKGEKKYNIIMDENILKEFLSNNQDLLEYIKESLKSKMN